MPRRLMIICILGATVGMVFIPLNPVASKLTKLAFLGCLAVIWTGGTCLLWKHKHWRMISLILPLLAVMPFCLPGGEVDVEELRHDYVQRMVGFEGTRYRWGGENARGIDCSGLPRRALRDALLHYGVRHFNGRAFRGFAAQWWFDASARAMGTGYRDFTMPLGITGTLAEMDTGELLPGDLAVTVDGVHMIAYAGGGRWIQADPRIGSVTTLDPRRNDNVWFHAPVNMHRWRVLAR